MVRLAFILLLLSVIFPVFCANASGTEDSVYFKIKLDTLGGLRAGRELQLTYALVNSCFDTVSYPVFNDSIQKVRGPEPYRCSSTSVIDGVERSIDEIGFSYLVCFMHSGQITIPSASVTVGGKTYTAPELIVSVPPAEVDMSSLKCRLKVDQLHGVSEKYRATLSCSACPDQNPPVLYINGEAVRPSSMSATFSSEDGSRVYAYSCYFTSKGYDVACNGLTFGGKPYFIKPQKSRIDDSDFYICIFAAFVLFELIWWLACRRRYRLEKDAALADFVLDNKTLPLIISWAYTHYGVPRVLSLVSTLFFSMMCIKIFASDRFIGAFFWTGVVLAALAFIIYRRQRRKLDFQSIQTSLDAQGIYDRIYRLSVTYDWDVDHYGEDCIVAHTNPSILSLTWGEQIFIVFDKGQVWVNSVNDLNRRTSLCSFGYNRRNIRRIREALAE